jgi:hypothetical protein
VSEPRAVLIPTVLVAGITWLISLLNPASAFVKAVKMIIADKYSYAVVVEIEMQAGALSDLMHGPHGTMDLGTANSLESAGEGRIEDRSGRRWFVFATKRPELPQEIPVKEAGRNKLVFKMENSHQAGGGKSVNYLVVSRDPAAPDDITAAVNARIRSISVIDGVAGQVTPATIASLIGGKGD